MITQETATYGPAFNAEYRGVAYHASKQANDRWLVLSCRTATKAAGFGQARWFDTIAEIETSLKAFSGLSALIEAEAVA